MWLHPGRKTVVAAIFVTSATHAQEVLQPNIVPSPDASIAQPMLADVDQLLHLEVFVNGRPTSLVAAFTRRQDGKLTGSQAELSEIGLRVPEGIAQREVEVHLDELPGVSHLYDEVTQTIHFTAEHAAQKPTRVSGLAIATAPPDPVRPPLGALVNYTLFGSGNDDLGEPRLESMAGEFETRTFGRYGLVENGFVRQFYGKPNPIRLDSSYSYEDPSQLRTWQAGDFISGGFSWTRPIRMAGVQIRRSFGLRPDIITMPFPTLSGSAAAPSTLDLFINDVRTFSGSVPEGPYEIDHPPIIQGSGQARIVLRDVLGREIVSTTPFYASPDLLAMGLTDFSAEIGFARRNYAIFSNDYDSRPVFSGSYRHGLTQFSTLQAHAESVGSLMSAGGGGIFTLGSIGLASMALSGSRTSDGMGALADAVFESRTPYVSLILRSQRTAGDYEDLASWTAVVPPNTPGERRIFGQPHELDQATVAMPLPWAESHASASYIQVRQADDTRSKIANLSFTQELGRIGLFASAVTDLEVPGSAAVFMGLSIPLGKNMSASAGATRSSGGAMAKHVEVAKHGSHEPGAFGWLVRASEDEQQRNTQAIMRYSAPFARFEASGDHTVGGDTGVTGLMEGALTLIGGGVYATPRLDDAFALVEVGAPEITILRENRVVGVTDSGGNLLIPDLAPFVSNRIALDPAGLPVDAKISATEMTATPFSRVASLVDLRVDTSTRSALVTLIEPGGEPIELGSRVQVEGQAPEFAVGYDGQTYVDELSAENTLLVTTPDGGTCHAKFSYHPAPGEQVHVDALVCMPVVSQ